MTFRSAPKYAFFEKGSPTDIVILEGRGEFPGTVANVYWGGINTAGQLWVGDNSSSRFVSTPLDPVDRDVFLQLDLVEQSISLTAWDDQSPKPDHPQISFEAAELFEGDLVGVGLFNRLSPNAEHAPVAIRYVEVLGPPFHPTDENALQPGDADQNYEFDQFDLVRVQQSSKYLTGQPATWGEGDWNGAPGGRPGNPPVGNGQFDHLDVVSALATGFYLSGPYATLRQNGARGDAQTSLVYDAATGKPQHRFALWTGANFDQHYVASGEVYRQSPRCTGRGL